MRVSQWNMCHAASADVGVVDIDRGGDVSQPRAVHYCAHKSSVNACQSLGLVIVESVDFADVAAKRHLDGADDAALHIVGWHYQMAAPRQYYHDCDNCHQSE
jgi:hypothetical protein